MPRGYLKAPAVCIALGGLLLLAVTVVGCGPANPTVSGVVTFRGQPLPSGTVLFHVADGRVEHSALGPDGHYTIANAPLGPVRITVQSHPAAPAGLPSRGGPPPAAPKELEPTAKEQRDVRYGRIPTRYGSAEQSGLTYTVTAGSQTHDIGLEP